MHNVGSIFRTSDAAGVSKLYLTGYTACPPRKEISKTALGADEFVAWSYYKNPSEVIQALKKEGYLVVALEKNAHSSDLHSFNMDDIDQPICLILGNEIDGVEDSLLTLSDQVLHIPMRGQKDSLNVSVAFGIGIYALMS